MWKRGGPVRAVRLGAARGMGLRGGGEVVSEVWNKEEIIIER